MADENPSHASVPIEPAPLIGSNELFCNGRVLSGPREKGKYFFIALGYLVIASALMFTVPIPYLSVRVSPAIGVIGVYLCVLSFVSFVVTSFSDPGIIPRETAKAPPNTVNVTLYKEVIVRDAVLQLKWCETCRFHRPPRATHCSRCNNCVEQFDHHCQWTRNCIGRHNYKYYFAMLFWCTILSLYALGVAVAHIVLVNSSTPAPPHTPFPSERFVGVSACLIAFAIGGTIGVGSLFIYHCKLVWAGLSTNEKLSRRYIRVPRQPFDNGPRRNITTSLCGVRPQSFVIAAGRTGREVRWDPIYPVDPVCLWPPPFPSPPVPATESIPLKPLRQKSVLTPAIPLSPPPVRASNPQASETT